MGFFHADIGAIGTFPVELGAYGERRIFQLALDAQARLSFHEFGWQGCAPAQHISQNN